MLSYNNMWLMYKSQLSKAASRSVTHRASNRGVGNNKTYEEYTNLVLPTRSNSALSIKAQSDEVEHVLHRAIDICISKLFFKTAFSLLRDKKRDNRSALIQAARDCGDREIEQRLKDDKRYAMWMATVPNARANVLKTRMMNAATRSVVELYGLEISDVDACKARVAFLTSRTPEYPFIFPEDPQSGKLLVDKPFLHPLIIRVLSHSQTLSEAVQRLLPEFSPMKGSEPEIPSSLLALASSAAYCALMEWENGTRSSMTFNKKLAASVYQDNLATLSKLAEDTKTASSYHPLMRKIFSLAYNEPGNICLQRPRTVNARMSATIVAINLD
ncbi:unnamed protein product [Somion occarium]|uniref:DUF6532 domain-containing protein n=1 Tax=Somion occarium TaxID=3059160 RepID=A0ABP1EBQ4_9APHY